MALAFSINAILESYEFSTWFHKRMKNFSKSNIFVYVNKNVTVIINHLESICHSEYAIRSFQPVVLVISNIDCSKVFADKIFSSLHGRS